MNVVIICAKLGPYHFARLQAAGKLWGERGSALTCVEISAVMAEYPWGVSDYSDTCFGYVTLFRERESNRVRFGELRRKLAGALDQLQPEVVVIPGWGSRESWVSLSWCCRRAAPRVVVSDSHARDDLRRGWKEPFRRWFVSRCDAGFAAGTPQVGYLEKLGLPREACVSGCDVVDNAHFGRHQVEPGRASGATNDGKLRLISCLRLIPCKNVLGVLTALRGVSMPWEWVIAGDGPERNSISRAIARLGWEDRVRVLGALAYDRLPEFYQLGEVYLQPSLSETWGLAVNEAMAAGLPVVVSRQCGCHQDLVQEDVNGYTFDARSSSDMVSALERVWAARGRWMDMGAASRQIIAGWSPESFAHSLWRACELAVERYRQRGAGGNWVEQLWKLG